MKILIIVLLKILFPSFKSKYCPLTIQKPPSTIKLNSSFTLDPISLNGQNYTRILIGTKNILKEPKRVGGTSSIYSNSYCPKNFKVPLKSDYEEILNYLGSSSYQYLTTNLGIEKNKYYATNTKGTGGTFHKVSMYIENESIVLKEYDCSSGCFILCVLDTSLVKVNINNGLDFQVGKEGVFNLTSEIVKGSLWRYEGNNKKIINGNNGIASFSQSGFNYIELWYVDADSNTNYTCYDIFVEKKEVSQSQLYSSDKFKIFNSTFQCNHNPSLHFSYSNVPLSPRRDGGYYIFYTNTTFNLHVLSYDKSDKLIKELDTGYKGYPIDITSTDYGFVLYIRDKNDTNYSFLVLYKKDFTKYKEVTVMHNTLTDTSIDATSETQLIYGTSSGGLQFGMRYMYRPDSGKLFYSRGRIFLIFSHYNYFLDSGGHTGDTVVTFNDKLSNEDFGCNWGSSHSLIQSVTTDSKYFWTVALGDAYPEGVCVMYTSKSELTSYYDAVNKKYHSRKYSSNKNLLVIKGTHSGGAYGKIGGIMYFKKYGIYAVVFSNTNDPNTNRHGIYLLSWKFENAITKNETKTLVSLDSSKDVNQVRSGRLGEDYIVFFYNESNGASSIYPGSLKKGSKPKVYIYHIGQGNFIVNGKSVDEMGLSNNNLFMSSNEDMRTFDDGVLIWASVGSDGKIYVNKLGEQRLSEKDDDITIDLDDLDLKEEMQNDNGKTVFKWIIWIVIIVVIILVVVFLLMKWKKFGSKREIAYKSEINLISQIY